MAGASVRETFDTVVGGAYDVIVAGGGASGLIAAARTRQDRAGRD